jgi:hypothetical protein
VETSRRPPSADVSPLQRACAIVGLPPSTEGSVTIEALSVDALPFLGESLRGQRAHRVVFRDWQRPHAPRMTNLGELTLWLVEGSLQLVKAVAARGSSTRPATSEEQRQLGAQGESYQALPTSPPHVTLLAALQAIAAHAPGDTTRTSELVASYVTHRTVRYTSRDVWIVDVRGIPPFVDRPGVPEQARNHLRHVVDAQSGSWLGSDTTPQPSGPQLVAAR